MGENINGTPLTNRSDFRKGQHIIEKNYKGEIFEWVVIDTTIHNEVVVNKPDGHPIKDLKIIIYTLAELYDKDDFTRT